MPEYLSPGVCLIEIASDSAPIEGLSNSTTSFLGSALTHELRRLVNQISKGEKTSDGANHSAALLELMAWIGDVLVRRRDSMGSEAYGQAARIAAAALSLLKHRPPSTRDIVKHIRFYEGQLVEPDDLRSEITYTDGNFQHSWGTGSGLQISVRNDGGSPVVKVPPGWATDQRGRNLVLNKPIEVALPDKHCAVVVARPKGRVAVLLECEVLVVDEAKEDDVVVGQLEKSSQGWRVLSGKAC